MAAAWDVDGMFFGTINGEAVNGMLWRMRLLPHGSEWQVGDALSEDARTTIRYCGDDVRERTERTIRQMSAALAAIPPTERDLVLDTFATRQLSMLPGGRSSYRSDPAAPGSSPRPDHAEKRSG